MRIEADEPCPLPNDPLLAEWGTAMSEMGEWGWIVETFASNVHDLSEMRTHLVRLSDAVATRLRKAGGCSFEVSWRGFWPSLLRTRRR
jgi:hypothetical protein